MNATIAPVPAGSEEIVRSLAFDFSSRSPVKKVLTGKVDSVEARLFGQFGALKVCDCKKKIEWTDDMLLDCWFNFPKLVLAN